jgi:hypothetical protein
VTPGIDATLLDPWPLWGIGLTLIAAFFVAAELGYFTYRRVRRHPGDKSANDEVQVLSTALVLLALLLGFTFSMALSRYDERRGQVVQEANDIGTAWLRAGLYDGDAAKQLQARLHAYAKTRVAGSRAGDTDGAYVDLIVEGAELRNQIWALTAEVTAPDRATPQAAALVAAVNAVLDTATRREAAIAERIPGQVWGLLIIYSVISAALLGYVFGAYGSPHRITGLVLFTLLSMTLVLIMDLDRPQGGGVRVNQQPLRDVIAQTAPGNPAAADPALAAGTKR